MCIVLADNVSTTLCRHVEDETKNIPLLENMQSEQTQELDNSRKVKRRQSSLEVLFGGGREDTLGVEGLARLLLLDLGSQLLRLSCQLVDLVERVVSRRRTREIISAHSTVVGVSYCILS